MSTNAHNGLNRWTLTPPAAQYQERLDALPTDDPVRRVLAGLDFELRRAPFHEDRSWPLTDGPTNRYWVLRSEDEDAPVVEVVFEIWNRRITRLAFRIVDLSE